MEVETECLQRYMQRAYIDRACSGRGRGLAEVETQGL